MGEVEVRLVHVPVAGREEAHTGEPEQGWSQVLHTDLEEELCVLNGVEERPRRPGGRAPWPWPRAESWPVSEQLSCKAPDSTRAKGCTP
jgi:hypothetical protein